MKQLTSYRMFLARYFFWAGAVILLISAVIPNAGPMRAIGSLTVIAGSLVDCIALGQEIWIKNRGAVCTPDRVTVILPAPSPVLHIRGVFFFILECTVGSRTVRSPLMALPRWSRHVQNGTLASAPKVTVYEKDGKTLVKAYL